MELRIDHASVSIIVLIDKNAAMNNRTARIASSAKKEVALILRERKLKELKDERLQGLISVTDIEVEDKQHFKIFISLFEKEYQEGVLKVLNGAIPAIRGELARRLRLRLAPSLSFHPDNSIQRASEINHLLDQIMVTEKHLQPLGQEPETHV